MIVAERQTLLQQILAQRGIANIETLTAELRVSGSTIRRDLEALEQQGLVKRTHGGVVWLGSASATTSPAARPYAFDQRMGYQNQAKQAIARAARQFVQPGQTILIDGGTTTFYLAQELIGQPLQLVTNSLPIANLFLNDDKVELILTGGLMYPRYGVLLGPTAENTLAAIHTKTLFLSVAGIHDNALYNQNLLLVQSEKRMMAQAQQVILLVDSSKFGQQALVRLCGLEEIDIVISDPDITDEQRRSVANAGCELVIAGMGEL